MFICRLMNVLLAILRKAGFFGTTITYCLKSLESPQDKNKVGSYETNGHLAGL